MRPVALFVLVFCWGVIRATAEQQLCFARNEMVWLATVDGRNAHRLFKGSDPDIAPAGDRIAFTRTGKGDERFIAVYNLRERTEQVFRGLPSNNAYGPIWSPDGTQLLFNVYVNSHWRFGTVQSDGTRFQFFGRETAQNADRYSPGWSSDGKTIFCQDLDLIYEMSRGGQITRQWKIKDLAPGGMNSGNFIRSAGDGKSLLIDADLLDGPGLPDWDGPPPALYLVDLASARARRVTKLYAWQPCWLNDREFVFAGTSDGRQTSIYRGTLESETAEVLVRNAERPSVSKR